VDMRIDPQWLAHRSILAVQLGWAQIRTRNPGRVRGTA
jgi:hypothetical protein